MRVVRKHRFKSLNRASPCYFIINKLRVIGKSQSITILSGNLLEGVFSSKELMRVEYKPEELLRVPRLVGREYRVLRLVEGHKRVTHQQAQGLLREGLSLEKGALDLREPLRQLDLEYLFDFGVSGPLHVPTASLVDLLGGLDLDRLLALAAHDLGVVDLWLLGRDRSLIDLLLFEFESGLTHDELLLFGDGGSLLLELEDAGHDVDEHAALEEGLACVVLEAHDGDAGVEDLLGVADAVDEVAVAGEERDRLDVGAEGVVDEVDGDGHVHLRLHLPLDLLLATATTLRRLLLVLPDVDVDVSVGLLEDFLVEATALRVGLLVLARHEADRVKLVPRDLLEEPQQRVEGGRRVHRVVQILQADLKVRTVYYQHVLRT